MLVDKNVIEVTGTLAGERIDMKFDEDSAAHLMAQFIDLYNDPETAVIREYATNALDSHVEAGNTDPIAITLPSTFSPFLKIRDWGIGMDGDTIRNIYSKYGASTKRESNDFQGQLGLGCKSALTYTNQFTLTGIKDGRMTTVAISRMDNGGGSMTIVNETDTDQPNGVEVVIPVKNGISSSIEQKAREFFKFWKDGTVLINGEAPESYTPFLKITDEMVLVQEAKPVRVVMGNVAYPVNPADLELNLPHGMSAVIFVPMGAVNFTPSRESLRMTPKTKAALIEIGETFEKGREKAVQREIAQAKTLFEAIEIFKNFKGKVSNGKMTPFKKFKGRDVPAKLEFPTGTVSTGREMYWGKKSEHWDRSELTLQDWPQTLIIKNWAQSRFTAATKKKLIKWAEEHERGEIDKFVLIPDNFSNTVFDKKHVVDWEEIRVIKLEYQKHNRPKKAGTYNVALYSEADNINTWNYGMDSEDFEDMSPIYYSIYYKDNAQLALERNIMKQKHKNFVIVSVTSNREKKFLRLFPNAIQVGTECSNIAAEYAKSLDPLDLEARRAGEYYSETNKCKTLGEWMKAHPDGVKVLDPELQRFIEISNRDLKDLNSSASLYGHYLTLPKAAHRTDNSEFNHIWDNYPLIDNMYSFRKEHVEGVIIYLNAVYRANIVDHCAAWDEN